MANTALLIEWGMPRQGRETKALEVFFNSIRFWETLRGAGRIESYQTFGSLDGNQEQRSGFLVIQGSADQIDALVRAEDYRQVLVQVVSIATNVCVTSAETNEAMGARMTRYADGLAKLGI